MSAEMELKDLQIKYLVETVLLMSQDLTRAGMSEYTPSHAEMINLGRWSYGLLEKLEIDLSTLEVYSEEV